MDSGSSSNKLVIPSRDYGKINSLGGQAGAPPVGHQKDLLKGFDYNSESQALNPLLYDSKNQVKSSRFSGHSHNDEYTDIIRKAQDSFPDYVNKTSKIGPIPCSAIPDLSNLSSKTSIPALIKNIKEIYESKRMKALEKENIKINSIKLKTYEKIKELIELESYLVSQLNLLSLNKEPAFEAPATKVDLIQSNPILKENPVIKDEIEGYLINSTHISTDLENVKDYTFPPSFIKGSNFTFFNKNEILVADANCSVFSINVNTGYRKNFSKFKVKRTYFSLCIIKNKPTVIAGIDSVSKSCCDTVEYLQGNNIWVKGSSLNQIRSHCSSISHNGCAFVMGGFSGGYVDSIEKFEHTWQLLSVRLPSPMSKFILCSKGTEIFVFGGKTPNGEIRSVFILDTIEEKFRKSNRNLGKGLEETNNGGVIFRNDQFYILDGLRVIKYKE